MAKTKLKPKNNKGTTDIWYTLIAIFVGVCLLAGLLVAILKPTGLWDSIVLHTNTAVKSEHYSVNNAQFQYTVYSIYNNYYQQYYSTYGSTYMSYFGLTDPSRFPSRNISDRRQPRGSTPAFRKPKRTSRRYSISVKPRAPKA